jgi:hypothetical protein
MAGQLLALYLFLKVGHLLAEGGQDWPGGKPSLPRWREICWMLAEEMLDTPDFDVPGVALALKNGWGE